MAENSAVVDTLASGDYPTEIELFAVASWLNTPIYTYGDAFKWQKHRPLPNIAFPFEPPACCVYIKNTSEHFMPVLGM